MLVPIAEFWIALSVAMYINSLPYEVVLKLTLADALDYSRLIPNVRSE